MSEQPAEYRSLTGDLRASIESRRHTNPDTYRLARLEQQLPEMQTALKGCTWHTNTAVGEARQATAKVVALEIQVAALVAENEQLKIAIGTVQADMAAMQARLDKHGTWINGQVKQGKTQ